LARALSRCTTRAACSAGVVLDGVDVVCDTIYLGEVQIVATTMVHVRVDKKTKQRAAKSLARMGISVSDAVRMLLVRVAAEKALPFDVKLPNTTTVRAMRAADWGKGRRHHSAGALLKELGI